MEKIYSQNTQPIIKIRENLGTSVKTFPIRNRNLKRWLALILGILLILISLAGAAILSIRAWQAYQSHGWSIIMTKSPIIVSMLIFFLPLGILLILWAKRHWNDGIIVYEQGFTQLRNKKTHTWFWTEINQLDTQIIRNVFGGSEVNSRVEISIEGLHHPPTKIKHKYENMTELAQMIRNNTLPVLFPKLLPLIADKKHTIFNKNLELGHRGIRFNQSQLDWGDINAIETQRGNLIFKAKDQSKAAIKIPLNQIKNLDLLLFIIHNPILRENLAS